MDPFFVPTTEEEREEFGEEGQGVGTRNLARALIDEVRQRKGLSTERKVGLACQEQSHRGRGARGGSMESQALPVWDQHTGHWGERSERKMGLDGEGPAPSADCLLLVRAPACSAVWALAH